MSDQAFMARALQLAEQGLYSVHPNPRVGCVLVRDGRIVGEGWHRMAGTPHAEVHALAAAGELARGATAYVSLEPCSHHGRTPPCAQALVDAGVVRVVAAMQDPNPQVAGRGLELLRSAGIAVQVLEGALQQQALELNRGFVKRMRSGLPWVSAKLAMSLDGRTAMASGESQWITGPAARADVQRLRARSSVVVSGADTVLLDDARLTVRAGQLELPEVQKQLALQRPPMRVLVDGRGRVPFDCAFYREPGAWLAAMRQPLQPLPEQAGLLLLPEREGHVDLHALLLKLAQEHQANEVLVEAGARLAGAFLQAGLLDELVVYMAPKLLGSDARPLFDLPLLRMAQAVDLQIADIRAVGADWRISCRL
ncbi:bifunctional diaminohydroxyphosphoribosylaminopyrimidine deaminase/5-amino-6-(5-phosphoribosylamino)uracil reductase RibD [Thiopseudomonas denitrificans]|uniref:Riboflavin biosynthesis protein RibD n=1 Tax=Thiopseudomonas denitrificans TaxID=1501432 RepID=A0A4R6U199_9GAMM|nr:bifunctional diaminohydroxyphosphoribosylaminopyrimidine deaminase/5-amino-6-(5-phosphoribosylamino)uracil reductase RibD [Thiopseudomonas denitrificans]TDQ39032.1 diaminohydroxyphosphoribosylaminopyrimidine deaminase [Thiopseudomonas denitrificans]